ncbi:DNA helicase [Agrobacterium bohemicum]|uniref:DNA helicase n=1 Tax=Agrobacterium bohemicum TaxID=2052828 RepID=A0A135P3U8_9HYPH|nr:DNA helicase [Agrobacterium bohemicum]KXG86068.1 DNA helicase [Agrobacterium bohemicum]
MKLSAPIFQLKRRAKLISRDSRIPLNEVLDQIAQEEGFQRWSMLSACMAAYPQPKSLLAKLHNGDMLLFAGRPGHGKTKLGLQLLIDSINDDRRAVLFTLEFTEQQAIKHVQSLEKKAPGISDSLEIITSDEISADYIISHLSGSKPGTVAVIDYLQVLDQQRHKPPLSEQVRALDDFAKQVGVIFGFISQIDRSFDADNKALPDIHDLRLPNHVELSLFTKACFVHNGKTQFQMVA